MNSVFKSIMNIRKKELPLALLMFFYFFLVIVSFWILKPIKKIYFGTFYDQTGFDFLGWQMDAAQAELLAKVMNMFVAFAAVVVFTWLARRMHRQQLTLVFSIFFIVSYVIYSLVINNPTDVTVWTFYLFGDLFSTLMVATFFAFLNDSVTPEAAKRLYGLIVLGGVTGGAFGTLILRVWIEKISTSTWMWICLGLALVIIVVALSAGRLVSKNPPEYKVVSEKKEKIKKKSNLLTEAGKLVFASKFLLSIVAIVGLYEIVSTTIDFQFTSTILHYLDGPAIGVQFANIYLISTCVAMFVQLFLTSFIMTRFGVKTALIVLPVAMIFGSLTFLVLPILWIGSFLNTSDSGFAYSINQSARETLYTITSKEEKYKAKAFIDMFVQRFAKALAVGVSLAVTSIFVAFSALRWLSLFNIAVIILWLFAVRYAGNKFKDVTEPGLE
ncbi:MAG: MFS transporter [Candidatus Aminicenantes bacterium]|nr:MFS transporter [Candidatus Aminicenantes bacterium]